MNPRAKAFPTGQDLGPLASAMPFALAPSPSPRPHASKQSYQPTLPILSCTALDESTLRTCVACLRAEQRLRAKQRGLDRPLLVRTPRACVLTNLGSPVTPGATQSGLGPNKRASHLPLPFVKSIQADTPWIPHDWCGDTHHVGMASQTQPAKARGI